MKIFLTGGTGFIGSHFINYAHYCGHEIIAISRNKKIQTKVPLIKQPEWVYSNIDNSNLNDYLAKSDVAVHLASHSANKPYDTYAQCIYYNVYQSALFLEHAIKAGIEKYIIAGTCFEYGLSANNYEKIPVNAELIPTNSYAMSKAMFFSFCSLLCRQHPIQIIYPRIFQVYGEGELETRLWPALKKASINGESFLVSSDALVRDFISVKDVAKKLVEYLDKDNLVTKKMIATNLGTGIGQTVGDFASYWWNKWESKGKLILNNDKTSREIKKIVAEI